MSDQSQSTCNPSVPPATCDPEAEAVASVTSAHLVPVPAGELLESRRCLPPEVRAAGRRLSSGRPPGAPPVPWEERPAFREVFLVHFPPGAAAAFREAGRRLYDAVLEAPVHAPDEPWVRVRLRALAEDLRFTGEVLSSLGEERVASGLSKEEMALAMRAEAWAADAARLAEAVEASVGPPPS